MSRLRCRYYLRLLRRALHRIGNGNGVWHGIFVDQPYTIRRMSGTDGRMLPLTFYEGWQCIIIMEMGRGYCML